MMNHSLLATLDMQNLMVGSWTPSRLKNSKNNYSNLLLKKEKEDGILKTLTLGKNSPELRLNLKKLREQLKSSMMPPIKLPKEKFGNYLTRYMEISMAMPRRSWMTIAKRCKSYTRGPLKMRKNSWISKSEI